MQYDRLTDEQAAARAQGGDDGAMEHLLRKYRGVVQYLTKSYFLRGAEVDDMVSEGMIGLFKAIRDFRSSRYCSFRTFADLCMRRQMITAVKANESQLAFVFAMSLDEDELRERVTGAHASAEDEAMKRIRAVSLRRRMAAALSPYELQVAIEYASGLSYAQIAERHGRSPKSVDNALERVRRRHRERILTAQ